MSIWRWDEWVRQLEKIQFLQYTRKILLCELPYCIKRFKWWHRWEATRTSTCSHNSIQLHANKKFWVSLDCLSRSNSNSSTKWINQSYAEWYESKWCGGKIWNDNWYTKIICLPWDAFLASLSLILIPCHISIRISVVLCVYVNIASRTQQLYVHMLSAKVKKNMMWPFLHMHVRRKYWIKKIKLWCVSVCE